VEFGVELTEHFFAGGLLDHVRVHPQHVPDLHIVLQEHLVLLHELDWDAKVLCH
jgi:hypothetical protein